MHTARPKPSAAAAFALLGVLLLSLAGCVHRQPVAAASDAAAPATGVAVTPDIYAVPSGQQPEHVVRTGRYQLVPLAPTAGERHLLQQIVSIDLPPSLSISVRDGLAHVLRDSGLHLCSRIAQLGFFSLPLPAVHRKLGPTTLRAALQVLAGPAWRLYVDYAERTICFARRPATASHSPDSQRG